MGFLKRSKHFEDALAQRRTAGTGRGLPAGDISAVLQELELPYHREADVWKVEVGGAWAVVLWEPEHAAAVIALAYEQPPAPSAELVRANADPGVAWYGSNGEQILRRTLVPGAERAGMVAGLRALGEEAGGERPQAAGGAPPDLAELLAMLDLPSGDVVDTDLGAVRLTLHAGVLDARMDLGRPGQDAALADWRLEMSNWSGARLGGGDALAAICGVSAAELTPAGLAWAIEQPLRLARSYGEMT